MKKNRRVFRVKIPLLILSIPALLLFQNCSGSFKPVEYQGLSSSNDFSQSPQRCTLQDGTQINPGESISGYTGISRAFPSLCGSQVTSTCQADGNFEGTFPLFESCTQYCQHPDTGQAVDVGFEYVYFSISNGTTQAQCDAARVSTLCQQATGRFDRVIPQGSSPTCLVQGQVCAYTASTGTALPTGNLIGSTVSGYGASTATYPNLCGSSLTRTCQAGGWTGTVPLYTNCSQKCLHPDSGQPVDAGTKFAYYTRNNGTTEECSAARVEATCQASTGLHSPPVPNATTRFASCQIQDVPSRVTFEMLSGSDTRYNVFKQNCTACHSTALPSANLNLQSATDSKAKATLILSRMKHENQQLDPMPPTGKLTDGYKIALVEKWVSLGAPSDSIVPPPPPTPPGPTTPPAHLALTCEPATAIPKVPIKRISKLQYTNSIMSLLNSSGHLQWSDRANEGYRLMGSLAPLMNTVPDDNSERFVFSSIDQTTTQDHFFSYVVISSSIADSLVKSANWLRSNSKVSCLEPIASNTHPADSCIRTFIQKFGQKALRKKIATAEETEYLTLYKSGTSAQDGLATLIQTFLISPRFLNIIEVDGKPTATDPNLLELNDFELAQRLSFHFLQGIPSDAMMDAAQQGLYTSSETSYKNEVAKILKVDDNAASPNTMNDTYKSHPASLSTLQKNYFNFFGEWLEIHKIPEIAPASVMIQIDAIYGYPERHYGNSNVSGPIGSALKDETYNFVQRLAWVENKKFYDLMTDKSIISTNHTRSLYNLPTPSTTYSYGHAVQSMIHHTGLLTRALVTLQDGVTDDTHPFLRGAFIRRKILCDVLPSPNPDALPDRALSSGEIVAESKRIQYESKVTAPECVGCHAQINPLGFALDDFDSLSRYRGGSFEPVFETIVQANGSTTYRHVKNVPVNSSVTNLNIDQPTGESVDGGVEFSDYVGRSYKANMCFTRQVFRHTMGRFESSADACILNDMHGKMTGSGGSIKKMILEMPHSRDFKMKRIGG